MTDETRRRVVIAEDETLIRLDLKEMLQEEGFDVVAEAGDGKTAVDLVEEYRPELVILDVKMPVMDGITAAEQVVATRAAAVVILTAFSQRELVARARDAGAMAYVVKPFTKADLMPAIEMAVSRHAELTALEGEIAGLTERLEVRKLVERAKGFLQSRYGLSEPEAFRWIQKASMDRRMSMRQVAEVVIEDSTAAGTGTEPVPDPSAFAGPGPSGQPGREPGAHPGAGPGPGPGREEPGAGSGRE